VWCFRRRVARGIRVAPGYGVDFQFRVSSYELPVVVFVLYFVTKGAALSADSERQVICFSMLTFMPPAVIHCKFQEKKCPV